MGLPLRKYFGFLEHVEELMGLFAKADQEKLQAALNKRDLNDICKVLGVEKEELRAFLNDGKEMADVLAKKYPELRSAK